LVYHFICRQSGAFHCNACPRDGIRVSNSAHSCHYLLEKTPGIKHIYSPTKEVMSSFVGDKKKFNDPVWVKTNENPEIWRIGFLTQKEMGEVEKHNYVAVYLPHSYAISGWVIVTEEKNIKPVVGMTAASAMKFAVSGGVAGFHSDDTPFTSADNSDE